MSCQHYIWTCFEALITEVLLRRRSDRKGYWDHCLKVAGKVLLHLIFAITSLRGLLFKLEVYCKIFCEDRLKVL